MSRVLRNIWICVWVILTYSTSTYAQLSISDPPNAILSARGTLVTMFPTKDGLVLASDEAMGNSHGATIGQRPKIFVLDRDSSHAIVSTGIATFFQAPPTGTTQQEWILSGKGTLFDATEQAKQCWEKEANHSITKELLDDISSSVVKSFQTFVDSRATPEKDIDDSSVFQVVLFEFDHGTSTMGYFKIGVVSPHRVISRGPFIKTWSQSDRGPLEVMGEADYFNKAVLHGPYREMLPIKDLTQYTKSPIQTTSEQVGRTLAKAMINTACTAARAIPPRSPLGVPVQVEVLR